MIRAGQEVVCIKKAAWKFHIGTTDEASRYPVYGEVVRVEAVIDGDWLLLVGFGERDTFHKKNFRPTTTYKNDIEEFKRISGKAPSLEDEHV